MTKDHLQPPPFDWSQLSFEYLCEQYQTEVSVGALEEEKYLQMYVDKSAQTRELLGPPLVYRYGAAPAENVRMFAAKTRGKNPTVINLKGGYWRIPNADWVDFVASGFVLSGTNVVNVDYGTMPNLSMAHLVEQVGRGIAWVIQNAEDLNVDLSNLHLVGHSAGGHLAGVVRGSKIPGIPQDIFKSTTIVSGFGDIGFARYGHLSREKDAIHLSAKDATDFSPLNMNPEGNSEIFMIVGEQETSEFHRQAEELAKVWENRGANTKFMTLPGHHYSLYYGLHNPDSDITKHIFSQVIR